MAKPQTAPGLDTKAVVLNLDGKPTKLEDRELTVGRAIAIALVSGTKSPDPLRAYLLGKKLMEEKHVTLDASEKKFIKDELEKFTGFTNLVIGQILEKLQ